MFVPAATYRIQFHKDFTFRDLLPQIPYLKALGIDTIYASPMFKARPGSTHGYDVTDPLQLNPEIGSAEDFKVLQQTLKENQLNWLQDIVPNHMAFHQDNAWLMDIFERGPKSEFYHFFDINWEHENPELTGKVMAPFLGSSEAEAIENGDIHVIFSDQGFKIQFYDNQYPASFISWPFILEKLLENGTVSKEKTREIKNDAQDLAKAETAEKAQELKAVLLEKLTQPEVKELLQNGMEKLQKSQEFLPEMLDLQFFRLTLWSRSDEEINYRRFFTINELICLRMEDNAVFAKYHEFIAEQYNQGYFQGLRIDHIDGLADPVTYLEKLRALVGENCYTGVEKILDLGEELPQNWPVQGSTGYFFLALVNQLFTRPEAVELFDAIYHKHVPGSRESDYEQLVFEKKMFMLQNHMHGEINNLFALLKNLELLPNLPGYTEQRWKDALHILLAAFPVYRIYTNQLPVTGQDAGVLQKAFACAEKFALHLKKEFTYFQQLFQEETHLLPCSAEKRLQFLMRCQQFTGPLAAKGVEDTTFYNYNRLISHNEVGDDPAVFGITVSRFHQEMLERQHNWPLALNATATHDTKRGEDARARLNVLTEMPEKWAEMLEKWEDANKQFLKTIDGQPAPSANRIFFLYQALLAAYPMDGEPEPDFLDRVKEALTKAMREAKMYSNWSEPNEQYEAEALHFVENILAENTAFQSNFQEFAAEVSFYGMLYSLGQVLLKITAPGVPDLYQGCELWDLSMVDPDNRRPVDFQKRQQFLNELQEMPENGRENALKTLMQNWQTGQIKLFTTWQALQFRNQNRQLFNEGEYIPLQTSEPENLLAYARKYQSQWCLVVVPLAVVKRTIPGQFPLGEIAWSEITVQLPSNAPQTWRNIFSGERISGEKQLKVAVLFKQFPVALLTSENL